MQVKWVVSVLVGVALLSACGDGSSTGSSTTGVNLNSTSFATLAPTLSSLAVETSVPAEGQISPVAQEYTIQPTDTSRVKVANLFGITVAVLDQANVATPSYSAFYPGLKIVIPAGAKVPGPTPTPTPTPTSVAGGTDTATSTATTTADATSTSVASNGSGCATGSYVITADDTTRTKVAKKFDITVDQLDAANANTKGYSAFYPGLKIVIPCT